MEKKVHIQSVFSPLFRNGLRTPYWRRVFEAHSGGLGVLYHSIGNYITEEQWNDYQWNPPQYSVPGAIYRVGRWEKVGWRESPPSASDDYQYAFFPDRPEIEGAPPFDENAGRNVLPSLDTIPEGWQSALMSSEVAGWTIRRRIYKVPADRGYSEPDLDADSKPTWEDLLRGERLSVFSWIRLRNPHTEQIRSILDQRASQPIGHSLAEGHVYVGSGIEHMDSLDHLVTNSQTSGGEWPLAVLSQVSGKPLHLWTPHEAAELLHVLSIAKNRSESAANIVRNRSETARARALDETGGLGPEATEDERLDAREAAFAEHKAIGENLDAHFAAALAEVDGHAGTLPEEPDRARAVLKMRAGIEANRRRDEIINVVEAQDAFLPASCVEERDALQQISWHHQRAILVLDRAEDIPAMQAAYDEMVEKVAAVKVLNTPDWQRNGQPVTLDADGRLAIEWDPASPPPANVLVTLLAQAPPDIENDVVAIEVQQPDLGEPHNTSVFFARHFNEDGDGPNRRRISLQYTTPDIEFPEEVDVRLVARNTCGPSALVVRFRRKA